MISIISKLPLNDSKRNSIQTMICCKDHLGATKFILLILTTFRIIQFYTHNVCRLRRCEDYFPHLSIFVDLIPT